MNKRTVSIEEIIENKKYIKIFDDEIKKIREIPKMPKCEFIHIGATSTTDVIGEKIVDILVVVENLHEITTFDEKRLNNISYHRIAHNGIKGVIKYARLTDYFSMSYDVINKEYTFKDYSNKKLEFINKMLKKVEIDD